MCSLDWRRLDRAARRHVLHERDPLASRPCPHYCLDRQLWRRTIRRSSEVGATRHDERDGTFHIRCEYWVRAIIYWAENQTGGPSCSCAVLAWWNPCASV